MKHIKLFEGFSKFRSILNLPGFNLHRTNSKISGINEGKNYSDIYHSIWLCRSEETNNDEGLFKTIKSIMESGIKFTTNEISKNDRISGFYKFLGTGDYFISITRDKSTTFNYPVTFVLDGEAISNRWKIEPFNLGRGFSYRKLPTTYRGGPLRHAKKSYSEEKIIGKENEHLPSKYIREIVLYNPSKKLVDLVKSLGVKVNII